MYASFGETLDTAFVILRVENTEPVAKAFAHAGIKLLSSDRMYKI